MKNFFQSYVRDTLQRLIDLNRLEDDPKSCEWGSVKEADRRALAKALRAHVQPSVLMQHDRMRAKGKSSVAAVRQGVCGGCHMMLALGNLNSLHRGDELRHCGNCGRYLYLPEDSETGQSSMISRKKAAPGNSKPSLALTSV